MTTQKIDDYFRSKVPKGWFTDPLDVQTDSDEILVIGTVAAGNDLGEFRESTRAKRVEIAQDAETRFSRKVSWGVKQGGTTTLFSNISTPVMTRLRLAERVVLDTLVDAGVARSRSDALAWCVRLVGRHQGEWLDDLRDALVGVERIRAEGPTLI